MTASTTVARVGDDPAIVTAFAVQAKACREMEAPFNARVCDWLAAALDDTTALGRRVTGWPRANRGGDLVPLRCCAGFHALARSGNTPALTAAYPPHEPDDAALGQALAGALGEHDAFLATYLDSPPQTNEVGRSAILLGGVFALAQRVDMPIALHEIGASAGLNLNFDRWAYDLGQGGVWGDEGAPVRLSSVWTGATPAHIPFVIASRAAADLRPLDPGKPEDRERLLSYIWPDQAARLVRIAAALDVAAASGPKVRQADARAWIADVLAPEGATPGVTTLLFHSVFIQYLDPPVRAALIDDIFARGRAATKETPFAWLVMEGGEDKSRCELRLTVWPAGETIVLADVDWHGRRAHWR